MKVEKEILLDQAPGLYAVGAVILDGERYYAAASENRDGKVFLIHAVTREVNEIQGGSGGVMAVLEAGGESAVLCIEEFYPVFDSATAKIVKVALEKEGRGWAAAQRSVVAKVPYVHRIAQLREADGCFIAAGKLCRHKDVPDDWSTPGSMEIGRYDKETGIREFERVQDGIYQHHAMFVVKNSEGYDDLYYGGREGAYCTVRKNGRWETRQLLNIPVSDLVYLDLDGDGKEELAVIEGFHGDRAVIFKDNGNGYERVIELPLDFGHVLWGGEFLGAPGLITGSRGGDKKLMLYRFLFTPEQGMHVVSETVIDEGQAPAQIVVTGGGNLSGNEVEIVAANHGAAQLARYRFRL